MHWLCILFNEVVDCSWQGTKYKVQRFPGFSTMTDSFPNTSLVVVWLVCSFMHVISQDCTIHVGWHQPYITEEAIRVAFQRFGDIQTVTMDRSHKYVHVLSLILWNSNRESSSIPGGGIPSFAALRLWPLPAPVLHSRPSKRWVSISLWPCSLLYCGVCLIPVI